MKEKFLDKLMVIFEQSLENLQEPSDEELHLFIKESSSADYPRIWHEQEINKLSAASCQLLSHIKHLKLLTSEEFEQVLLQVQISPSHTVPVDEINWIIKEVLGEKLDSNDKSALYLMLHDNFEHLTLH